MPIQYRKVNDVTMTTEQIVAVNRTRKVYEDCASPMPVRMYPIADNVVIHAYRSAAHKWAAYAVTLADGEVLAIVTDRDQIAEQLRRRRDAITRVMEFPRKVA